MPTIKSWHIHGNGNSLEFLQILLLYDVVDMKLKMICTIVQRFHHRRLSSFMSSFKIYKWTKPYLSHCFDVECDKIVFLVLRKFLLLFIVPSHLFPNDKVTNLLMWRPTNHGSYCELLSVDQVWKRSDDSLRSRRRCCQLVEFCGDFSSREMISFTESSLLCWFHSGFCHTVWNSDWNSAHLQAFDYV